MAGAADRCREFGNIHTQRASSASPVPPIGACRGALHLCTFSISPKTGGSKGVEWVNYGNRRMIPTGQWSDPVTPGMMKALATDGARFLVTKK
jgi:hypothetical protein